MKFRAALLLSLSLVSTAWLSDIRLVSAQTIAPQISTTTPLVIARSLYLGVSGSDVSALQQFLKNRGYFTYPTITGYFGPITQAAVQLFQAAEGIVSSGSPNTTGYGRVGPLTRAKLATLPNPNLSPSATPPLTVSVSATSTATSTIPVNPIPQPYAPGNGYTPGFGGGGSPTPPPDTTAPTVSVTAPADGATIYGTSVTISADASDSVGVSGVQFAVNGVNVGSEDTSSPYSITWDSTATSSGSKSIVAVARDAAGNYATSTAISVTLDNTAPVISSIASSTNTISATITWTTDEASDSRVDYGLTASYGSATTSATLTTSHSLTLTGLASYATYHFRIQSVDESGNVSTSSDSTFTTTFLLSEASTGLVDFVMIGDSNQQKDGHGFDDGFGYALAQKFTEYAGPLYQPNGSTNNGASDDGGGGATIGAATGAPSDFDTFLLANGGTVTEGYAYYTGTNISSGSTGVSLTATSPLDVNAALRAYFGYGTFASGGGSFKPGWRLDVSPFTKYAESSAVSVSSSGYGTTVSSIDLGAASRSAAIGAKWSIPSGGVDTIVENFLALWARIGRPDRTTGFSYNTLYGTGGASLYDMAAWLQGQSDARLTNYFSAIRYLQVQAGQSPVVVVYINSGFNDRNETSQPSLGPSPSASPDSADAYVDNLKAVVNRVEEIWTLNDWDTDDLAFLVVPSHPISDPDDAELTSYRAAATTYAESRQRIAVVDASTLITSATMSSEGYYASGGTDKIHLVQSGYRALATLIANLF